MTLNSEGLLTYIGSCHCGAVRYEAKAAEKLTVQSCNCSICAKTGYLHLIVPKKNFKLLTDKDNLSRYQFNTKVAEHYFCKTCGIKSFYIPRSNPDGVSINVRCLNIDFNKVTIEAFNGKNWEQNAGSLKHLSE